VKAKLQPTKTRTNLATKLLSLLPLALLAISSTASAQQCNDMDFTEVTSSAGINHVYVWPDTSNNLTVGGATAVDVNGDGWLDIYAVQGDGSGNFLYINDQNGGFTEEAAARGVELNGFKGTGASAADYDNDGDMDIVATIYYDGPRLLINDGTGNFTVEALAFPNQRVFSSSWGDVDNDGYLELAVAQWMSRTETGPQGLRVYKNNAGTLSEYEFRTVAFSDEHTFAPRFADLNGDRLSDIHSISDYGESRLYMNVGGGMFDGSAGYGGDNDMGHAIGDYDKDGDLDIFTTDIEPSGGNTKSGNTLWNNNGQASFTNVSQTAGIANGGWAWAGSFGDLDLDADLDIYHVNGFTGDGEIWKDDPHLLFMNNDDGTFTEVANCAGAGVALGSQGRGMHLFDYDNDGDLDIFIVNNRYMITGQAGTEAAPVLLRNDTPRNGRHWLKVTLDGTPPMHRDGIGSRVYVKTGSTNQMHEMHASTNFLSQDAGHIAHFGLDTVATADEVKAEWVTGDATVLTDVGSDQQISIPSPTATVSSRTPAIGQNVTATSHESAQVEWEIDGSTFADPVTTSFSTGGSHELKLLVYNGSMTQVIRTELIRVVVAGVAGTPEITSPTPGTTLAQGSINFSWNSNGASVDEWQLEVGTSVGSNNLYDSGPLSTSTTAALVAGLPEDSSTLHVTLRWTDGGSSSELNYTYTAATAGGGGGVPMMLSPADGSILTGSSETFTWSDEGAGATQWRLEVGSTVGASDIYGKSWGSSVTSQEVTVLPTDGSTVYVKLKWKISGAVDEANYTYTATGGGPPPDPEPEISSPAPGSTFAVGDVSFAWTSNGAVADDWQLQIGTSVSDDSLYDSGVLSSATLSAVVSGLPEDGSTLHVTLIWTDGGTASELNYTYTAATAGGGGGVPIMLSPLDGSTLTSDSETFTWSDEGASVSQWRVEVGTTVGGKEIYAKSLGSTTTSQLIPGLPTDGSLVYVKLKWRIDGVVGEVNYVYTATGGGPPPDPVPEVTSPTPGATFAVGDVSFAWTSNGAVADDWQLQIGTSVSDNSLYDSGVLASGTTSAVVSGLPEDGSTLHVTLIWTDGGAPSEANYTYTAATAGGGGGVPMILSPLEGNTLAGASETFTWSAEGATVTQWRLEVGSTVGARDIYGKSWSSSVTSQLVSGLPTDGSIVYVKLKWKVSGAVAEANYVYTAATE
jgi:hypothetical protein